MASLFYVYDSMILLTQLEWLKWSFYVLSSLFEHMGLKMDMKNMLGMLFQPCHIHVRISGYLYKQWVTR